MALTTAQLPALNNSIKADPTLNAMPNNPDSAIVIANEYNKVGAPAFVIWKTFVTLQDLFFQMDGAEFGNLTTANATRLQTMGVLNPGGAIPSPSLQKIFDDIYSGAGGTISRPALQAFLRRNASRGEKLYTTGTGTTATPGNLGFGDLTITSQDVESARNLG